MSLVFAVSIASVLCAALYLAFAIIRMLMVYSEYYGADLKLDYQARRRLVSTYSILSFAESSDPWLTEEEKKAFDFLPKLKRANRTMAVAVSAVVAALAFVSVVSLFGK